LIRFRRNEDELEEGDTLFKPLKLSNLDTLDAVDVSLTFVRSLPKATTHL
jgi:hypothetical protein